MTLDELTEFVTENGFPKFRAKQIYDWLYKNVTDFDNMRNIPADLKAFLKSSSYISVANIEKKLVSRYDKTVKYLFSFNDGECVESVVMSYKHGYSICISTQVGCKMGCTFCATGKSGFSRSLEPSEMLGQIEAAQRDLNIRISNIVLMGMGEPLDNFDNVVKFLRLVSSDNGLNIGMRHITLSTCGIVPKIYELAKEVDFFSVGTNDLTQYTLAIDRQNQKLDAFYDPHHPAVLAMIRMAAENAHAEGKWIGICGELGADLELTEEFLSMGLDELSVSPAMVLPLRKKIRETK